MFVCFSNKLCFSSQKEAAVQSWVRSSESV